MIRQVLATRMPGRRSKAALSPADGPSSLAALLRAAGPHMRDAVHARLGTLLRTLGVEVPASTPARIAALESELAGPTADRMWLALAVLTARLPRPVEVERAVRAARLGSPVAALLGSGLAEAVRHGRPRRVEVVTGAVLVDVHLTARVPLSTGVQRVTRETVRRWHRDHEITFIDWDRSTMSLLPVHTAELADIFDGNVSEDHQIDPALPVVVPWRSTYLLPELQADVDRSEHLHAMLQFSGNRSGIIGYDCVPISTAETTIAGMTNGFAAGLAAEAHADRICAISGGAAQEFRGWRAMLAGTGLRGPEIDAVPLPVEVGTPTADELVRARQELVLGTIPMLLVVGTHEPRKNHLAVLHAAEVLWREGRRFSLVFVAGRSWSDAGFRERLESLQAVGRPVHSASGLSDATLWAAYRLARFTVFPSLNEGFGLPVAESLAAGTPVVTSRFGSMAEIAADGGAVLVDPRDDHDLAAGMRRLLTDPAELARLRAEALARPSRTWDDYAAEVWGALVPDPGDSATPTTGRQRRTGPRW